MTTIAFNYKDKQVAVDSRTSAGNHICTDKASFVVNDGGAYDAGNFKSK